MDKSKNYKVVILETSDVHGAIFPIDYSDNTRKEVGLSKIATLVKEEREKKEDLILIDNGDMLQGTPLIYHYANIDSKGINPLIKVMNIMNYDAAVIGNHEFNYGKDFLNNAVEDSKFPWLSSNIIDKDTRRPYFGRPYIIKELENGIKVGIIGSTTKYIPNWEDSNNIKGLDFLDVIFPLKTFVSYLKNVEKVDVLIVSYHGGYERNIKNDEVISETGENQAYEICENIPEIDVLLTGHQHVFINKKMINGVLTVSPGYQGKALVKVEITLENSSGSWKVVDKDSKLLDTEQVKEDENILNQVKDYEKATQKWLDTPIGRVEGDMFINNHLETRLKDNAFVEFINKVQMKYAKVDISATSLFDNKAKGFNDGITMRNVVSNYIYPNTLKVIRIKGEDIKEALERSAAYFQKGVKDNTYSKDNNIDSKYKNMKIQPYNYDMWEGIDYKLDLSKPLGERVVLLNYKNAKLDMDKEYDVVMNNYRAGGGGDYDMFKDKPVIREINIDMSELIADYIIKKNVIKAEFDGNWEVIYPKDYFDD
ncbi:bifunctional metallophosphatase/5'-nucleotidase [Clostridium algidicarnis]|uniref:bifunctional metallophosphatase/5'-nucleotidase n=1 Tax=Clostridium algidicarnis TaxID=37659 RepID=UPI001C0B82AE|nr:bifunctional UDP-sugar hydrolase/5'-nucleotidase [Clostridium algidicarnis]MBU3193760.1 bifunctional metallophosphatase/5'-nucleotidase [Clostridium algidicarnis]